ncbi:ribonuclease P protein component [Prochlorococcus marinus]|uniref:ribonuclease P protein component n=1 Tax=Prochlorococcus marinus TaxID=1219 RepID=UPI0022B5189F|nr:ribonuclease P protein component [Prochlorococcus marinus]
MVLPKEMRLRGYKCFDYIHKSAKRYKSSSMILKVTTAKPNLIDTSINNPIPVSCKCAISISNKVSKKAVVRNRLRRLFHDHLRKKLLRKSEFGNNWALLSLTPNCLEESQENLLKECDKLFMKAGLKS